MQAGDAFDRYTIEAQIGAGGMGEVYRAYDPKLHRRVALKVLRLEGSGSTEQAERILREARAAAALDHPNAVHIYDVGEHDGRPFLAMELVEGKNLRTFVGDRSITIEQKIRWICDVGRALAAAHRRGLVHRDVKPDNVMVRDDGSIKVLDFGIARRAQAPIDPNAPTVAGAVETLTGDGVVVGTPMYMSPEQMRGEPVDHRTDQFAWGVLAFELLVGRLPWGPPSQGVRLVAAMLSEDAPRLTTFDPSISANVEAAVARALSRKRDDRFVTMAEAIAIIDGSSASMPPRTTMPTPVGRRRIGAPLAVVAAVGALVVGVLVWRRTHPSTTSTTTATSSTPDASSSHAVAVTDLPTPPTSVPEAANAFREGLQALRDGSWEVARRSFRRAVELDASMSAAHLRVAILTFGMGEDARSLWQRALLSRGSLDERDRLVLDAYDVVIRPEIPDWAEHRRILLTATARWPNDAELHMMLGTASVRLFDPEAAVKEYELSLQLDPMYADPATVEANALVTLGRFEDAVEKARDCERRFPASNDCVQSVIWVHRWLGPCDAMEAATRRALEHDNMALEGWHMRAQALYALGRPLESVGSALDHAVAALPEPQRTTRRKQWELQLDVLEGHFDVVDREAAALEASMASVTDEEPHALLVRTRIAALLESGRTADAATAADDFLKHVDGWTPSGRGNLFLDTRFLATGVLRAAGRIDGKALETARSGYLYRLATRTPPAPPGDRWLAAYAIVSSVLEDEAEAGHAVTALSDLGPPPPFEQFYEPSTGHTFVLAGRFDDALPHLERAVNACFSFDAPRDVRRASYFLGLTYEAKGDVAAACKSYADLLAHWGNAKPKSVTADLARARVSALKCAAQ